MRGAGAAPLRRDVAAAQRPRHSPKNARVSGRDARRHGNGRFSEPQGNAIAYPTGPKPRKGNDLIRPCAAKHPSDMVAGRICNSPSRVERGGLLVLGENHRLRPCCGDLIRLRCARPPSPEGEGLARRSIPATWLPDESTTVPRGLNAGDCLRWARTIACAPAAATSSGFAALGHLPQREGLARRSIPAT